jgi:hypothetical protein
MTAVWDYDFLKYVVGAACEKRSITATHNATGNTKAFKTRIEFWGHHLKKEGGWLGDQNKGKDTPWLISDFTITDVQEPEPISFALSTVKNYISKINEKIGAEAYYGYIGRGDSWRVERSTILKYKGNRADTLKPLLLDEIEEYILKHHAGEVVRGLEADDQCVMDCTADQELCLIGVDKDYQGTILRLFNPDKMEKPVRIKGLGSLHIDAKGAVRGEGRKFFYQQVLSADKSDNYSANSATTKKWGEKSAYKLLVDCETDAECWAAMVRGYESLYEAPTVVKGWRGDDILVDAMYMLQENVDMAHMLRKEGDFINVKELLTKLGVSTQ